MTKATDVMAEPRTIEQLLDAVVVFIQRFVVISDHSARALALWVAHNWAFAAATVTPYQEAHSAEEESGKTRLMEVLGLLVPNPVLAVDITDSVLFRMIEAERPKPTLFLDEMDAIFNPNTAKSGSKDSFRSLINAGYREGGKAYRSEGPNHDYRGFDVFCPKMFAGIGTLPRTTASRTVRHELKRRLADEPVEDFYPDELADDVKELTDDFEAWATAEDEKLRETKPKKIKAWGAETRSGGQLVFVDEAAE
jgi:hypothetical protein